MPILKQRVVQYVNDLPLEEQLKLMQGDRVPLAPVAAAAEAAPPADEAEGDAAEEEAAEEEDADAQA